MNNTSTTKCTTAPSSASLEPQPHVSAPEHRSSASKIIEAIKKPFHKDKEIPPALKENIERMEERREQRIMEMQKEGLDTSMLEGSKMGRFKQTLR